MSQGEQLVKPVSLRWQDGEAIKYMQGYEEKELRVKTGERHSVTMSNGTTHHLIVRVPNDGSTRQQRRAAKRGK